MTSSERKGRVGYGAQRRGDNATLAGFARR